ncbi:MAG: methyltransferase, partial [Lachnospiraceae bacterium]
MLIERKAAYPAKALYGVDTYGDAIQGARENTELAGENIHYVHRDFFDFTHRDRFDELIANMPAKGKKTKEEQDAFYQQFFEKAGTLLKKRGIMVLYTNETGFVKKQLRLHREFGLLKEYCIREKEGYCLFIIETKE